MTDSPEVVFGRWSRQYGDIFGLKIGERWMVVLSGQAVIKDALLNHGVQLAGRPIIYSSKATILTMIDSTSFQNIQIISLCFMHYV